MHITFFAVHNMLSQLLPTSVIAHKILCLAKSEQKYLENQSITAEIYNNFINLTVKFSRFKLTIFIAVLSYLNFRFFDW